LTCNNTANNCTMCADPKKLVRAQGKCCDAPNIFDTKEQLCRPMCPGNSQVYVYDTDSCANCNANCLECSLFTNNCTKCKYEIIPDIIQNYGSCYYQCSDELTNPPASGRCELCLEQYFYNGPRVHENVLASTITDVFNRKKNTVLSKDLPGTISESNISEIFLDMLVLKYS
jgi:hypothetical protein